MINNQYFCGTLIFSQFYTYDNFIFVKNIKIHSIETKCKLYHKK